MPRFRSGLFHSSDHFSQIIGAIASFAHALLPSHLDGSAVGLDGYEPVASCASVGFIQAASPGTFGGRSAAKARLLGEDHECRAAGVAWAVMGWQWWGRTMRFVHVSSLRVGVVLWLLEGVWAGPVAGRPGVWRWRW